MPNKLFIPLCIIILQVLPIRSDAQIPENYEIKGHIKTLQNIFIPHSDTSYWFTDNTIDNRLQLSYYPTDWLSIDIQTRNRFIYGDFVKFIPHYASLIDKDNSFFDLSFLWSDGNSYLFHTIIDRLNVSLTFNSWQITLGRQRINWGIDLAWNPNDIFNTFSFFDLEYPERPGTDALSIKYYSGITSYIEAVYQPAKCPDSTSVGILYRFNLNPYDIQILTAKMKNRLAIGMGFTGNIGNTALRSEITYFKPFSGSSYSESNGIVASLSAGYTFTNTWSLQLGTLFNSFGKSAINQQLNLFDPTPLSPIMLSRGKINLYTGISGRFGPLITPSLSIISNPNDFSSAVIPSISISASDNIDVSITTMLFTGDTDSEYAHLGNLFYLKFQYNF